MESTRKPTNCRTTEPFPVDVFVNQLSPAAKRDLESMQRPAIVPANRVLFTEKEE